MFAISIDCHFQNAFSIVQRCTTLLFYPAIIHQKHFHQHPRVPKLPLHLYRLRTNKKHVVCCIYIFQLAQIYQYFQFAMEKMALMVNGGRKEYIVYNKIFLSISDARKLESSKKNKY